MRNEGYLNIYTIFNNHIGFDGFYVVRRFEIASGGICEKEFYVFRDLSCARTFLENQGKVVLPRADDDEDDIVESWI